MSVELFKAQAHRLQAYLKANPEKAGGLALIKQSTCYELIAAIHGARNWNVLCATPEVEPRNDAELIPVTSFSTLRNSQPIRIQALTSLVFEPGAQGNFSLGGVLQGEVGFLLGRSGVGKSQSIAAALVAAIAQGYSATVLDMGRSYYHCTASLGGENARVEDLLERGDEGMFRRAHIQDATLATVEFEGLQDVQNSAARFPGTWEPLDGVLSSRLKPGHILVVDEVAYLAQLFGSNPKRFAQFLLKAKTRGALVLLIGQGQKCFEAFEGYPTPDRILMLTRENKS